MSEEEDTPAIANLSMIEIPDKNRKSKRDVVRQLEDLLDEAREGHFTGIAAVLPRADGGMMMVLNGAIENLTAVGALGSLQLQIHGKIPVVKSIK